MKRNAYLLFILTRLRLYGESYSGFRVLHAVVNNGRALVAECVARLRLSQFHAGYDVARVGILNLLKLLALQRVERAQSFLRAARTVVDGRVRRYVAADNLEDVDAARERVCD